MLAECCRKTIYGIQETDITIISGTIIMQLTAIGTIPLKVHMEVRKPDRVVFLCTFLE